MTTLHLERDFGYVIATFLGSAQSMFVTVSLGSGIESVIEEN